MLLMKFDYDWPAGFRDIHVWKCGRMDGCTHRRTPARVPYYKLTLSLRLWWAKNEQTKGLISNMWLFFCYTIQLITIKLCTKFQNPYSSGCWEIFDRKKCPYVLYKRERRKKLNLKKEGKMRISILISIYTVHFAILKIYTKFENTGSNRSWEICDRNFHWRERKMNK